MQNHRREFFWLVTQRTEVEKRPDLFIKQQQQMYLHVNYIEFATTMKSLWTDDNVHLIKMWT